MGQTFVLDKAPSKGGSNGSAAEPTPTRRGVHGSRLAELQEEVAQLRHKLTTLEDMDTSEVLRFLSSQHSRLREIQAELWEQNSHPPSQQFRSRQVEPLLSDTMVHFQIHSRLIAWLQHEWEVDRGQ